MPHMQGVKGSAVVVYAASLTTKQMWYHQLSRRVNNRAIIKDPLTAPDARSTKGIAASQKLRAHKQLLFLGPVVYATLGFIGTLIATLKGFDNAPDGW